jgi:PEP-CTERM motif
MAGDDFSITFNRDGPIIGSSFVFTADGFMETLGPGQSKTDMGVLADTRLTVGVTDGLSIQGQAEGYTVTLSEIPTGVPEPSAAAIFAVGLAGLAVARRKRYH